MTAGWAGADIPGLDRKDLDLTVTGNVLTLKGEKAAPKKNDQARREFRDGTLKVTFAKKPEHKPRQIPVLAR